MRIKAQNGFFVCAEQGGGINGWERPDALIANREEAHEWETFTRVDNADGTFSLICANGQAVSAEDGGGGPISTNRDELGIWERFIDAGGLIRCAARQDRYLRVNEDGTIDAMGKIDNLFFDQIDHIPQVDITRLQGAICIPTKPRVWGPAFLAVDGAEQDRYIEEVKKRRYTFMEILVSGLPYGDQYPEIPLSHDILRDGLYKIKQAGLVSIVAFDDRKGDDLSYLGNVVRDNADLIDWCMAIYEINGVLKDPAKVLSVLKQSREMLPDCLLAVHFEPLDEGRESYGLVDWQRAKDEADLNALFFQTAGWEVGPDEATARLQDFTRRLMNGFHGYPILSHGVYDFENTTSKTFRYEWSEKQAIDFTDHLINAPLAYDGSAPGAQAVKPSGFCDLGSTY